MHACSLTVNAGQPLMAAQRWDHEGWTPRFATSATTFGSVLTPRWSGQDRLWGWVAPRSSSCNGFVAVSTPLSKPVLTGYAFYYTFDVSNTGLLTATPPADFVGTLEIEAPVRREVPTSWACVWCR